jgi:hypothetical protein
MMAITFFDELFHPAKKCLRLGHLIKKRESFWVAETSVAEKLVKGGCVHFGYPVAIHLRKVESYCKRCGKVTKTKWEDRGAISSLTYDTGGEFDRNGIMQTSYEREVS